MVERHTRANGQPPTVIQIAAELGLAEKTVHYLLDRYGIPFQPRRRRTVATESEVLQAIRSRQAAMGGNSPTVGELSEALNLHPARVRRWLVALEKAGRLQIIDRLTYRVILEEA
jgi:DNA-binding IclR family transcriptional regulator